MRAATVYAQRQDRQKLAWYTCPRCTRRYVVFAMEGQDAGELLIWNGWRRITDEGMECGCLWTMGEPPAKPLTSWFWEYRQEIEKRMREATFRKP